MARAHGADLFEPRDPWDGNAIPRTSGEQLAQTSAEYEELLHKDPKLLLAIMDQNPISLETSEHLHAALDIALLKLVACYYLYDNACGLLQIEQLHPHVSHMNPIQEIRFLIYKTGIESILAPTPELMKNLELAAAKAHALHLAEEEVVALTELAILHSNADEFHKAIEYVMQAKSLAQGIKPYYMANTLIALSTIQSHIRRLPQAIDAAAEAYRIFKTLDYDYHVAYSLFYLGDSLRVHGSLDQAYDTLQEAMRIARKIGDDTTYYYAMSDIGSILRDKKEAVRALAYLEEAGRFYYQEKDIAQYIANMGDMVGIMIELGQKEKAERDLQEAQQWLDSTEMKEKAAKYNLLVADLRTKFHEKFGPVEKHVKVLQNQVQLLDERFKNIERISVAKKFGAA